MGCLSLCFWLWVSDRSVIGQGWVFYTLWWGVGGDSQPIHPGYSPQHPSVIRAKRNAASRLLPLTRPGAGDLAEECALLGISRLGPAWEAKGSDCQWEPGTGQGGSTGQTSLAPSWAHSPCPALPCPRWPLWRQSLEEKDTQPLQGSMES